MKQPSKDNILKAHSDGCEDVKKVIENLWPDEFEDKYDETKIYALHNRTTNNINIIHKISDSSGSLFHCFNLFANGDGVCSENDFDSLIKNVNNYHRVESFDTQKEFYKWALKQLS